MPVPFRFDTVVRVREAERDRCRVTLVQEQQREAALNTERQRISTERERALDDLRQIQEGGACSAEQALARRQHAERLAHELDRIVIELQDASTSVSRCRNELLEADTSVKGLEKLAGRQVSDQHRAEQNAAERDREDNWRAA